MRIVKSHQFWIGVAVGMFVVPVVLDKVAPNMKSKVSSSGGK